MVDISARFLEYFRLDRKRTGEGLTVDELERWNALKRLLNRHFSPGLDDELADRRQSVRAPTCLNCSFESLENFEGALITNLSSSGVFINTVSPLPIGVKLRLRILIAESRAEIELPGVVVSHNIGRSFDTSKVGMGVRFSAVAPEIVKQIHDLYVQAIQRAGGGEERRQGTERKAGGG